MLFNKIKYDMNRYILLHNCEFMTKYFDNNVVVKKKKRNTLRKVNYNKSCYKFTSN